MTGAGGKVVSKGGHKRSREFCHNKKPLREVSAPYGFTRLCLEPCCDISLTATRLKTC